MMVLFIKMADIREGLGLREDYFFVFVVLLYLMFGIEQELEEWFECIKFLFFFRYL